MGDRRAFQNATSPTFLEELFEPVLERLQILLWRLLTHNCHLFLTCCEEKVAVRLPQEHRFAELMLCIKCEILTHHYLSKLQGKKQKQRTKIIIHSIPFFRNREMHHLQLFLNFFKETQQNF